MCIGVPLPFLIGRRLQTCGGDVDGKLRQLAPSAMAYMTPIRRAVGGRPVRASFLLMWAPLPTSFLPLLIGYIIPRHELPLRTFVSGALPSKLLHFACDVLVGIEAGSLAVALDAHDDLPSVNDLPRQHQHARLVATVTLVLTIGFVAAMGYTMHQALKEMKAKGGEQPLHKREHESSTSLDTIV